LGDELTKDFLANIDSTEKEAAYQRFGSLVHNFHARHVVPFAHQDLEVSVLIAYQRDGATALWQSSRSALIEQYDHGAVGVGSFAATAWLSRVWKHGLDLPTAVVVAIFAAAVAKDSVDGCGKYTNVMIVEADRWRRVDQKFVNEIDQLYEVLASEIQPALMLDCLGERPHDEPSLTLEGLKGRIADAIKRLRDDTPEGVKRWRQRRWERLRAQALQRSPTDDSPSQPPSPESPEGSDES
jgi:hypothetical protein